MKHWFFFNDWKWLLLRATWANSPGIQVTCSKPGEKKCTKLTSNKSLWPAIGTWLKKSQIIQIIWAGENFTVRRMNYKSTRKMSWACCLKPFYHKKENYWQRQMKHYGTLSKKSISEFPEFFSQAVRISYYLRHKTHLDGSSPGDRKVSINVFRGRNLKF